MLNILTCLENTCIQHGFHTVPIPTFELHTKQSSTRYIYVECRPQASRMNIKNKKAPFLLIFKSIQDLILREEKTPEACNQPSNASFPLKPGTSWLYGPVTRKTLYTCSDNGSNAESTQFLDHCIWFHSLSDLWQRVKEPCFVAWKINSLRSLKVVHDEAKVHAIIPASAELEKEIQGNRQGEWTIYLCAINEWRPIGQIF